MDMRIVGGILKQALVLALVAAPAFHSATTSVLIGVVGHAQVLLFVFRATCCSYCTPVCQTHSPMIRGYIGLDFFHEGVR